MARLLSGLRALVAMLILVAGLGSALAQETDAPWQATITGQIEAFRAHDAPGAFGYASAPFHERFGSPEAFFLAIVGMGYAPIMESRSHSFGTFARAPDGSVAQQVELIGNDQGLYGAVYQLIEEPAGWRVTGVQLIKRPGLGV